MEITKKSTSERDTLQKQLEEANVKITEITKTSTSERDTLQKQLEEAKAQNDKLIKKDEILLKEIDSLRHGMSEETGKATSQIIELEASRVRIPSHPYFSKKFLNFSHSLFTGHTSETT